MLQFVIAGLVLGGIYAIASAGLVITYTSSGILNFAFGAMAYFIARLYYFLNTQHGWGIAPAVIVSVVVAAPLMGVVLYVVLFRFLRLSSPLIKVVATIGLLVAIPSLATWIFGNQAIQEAPGLAPNPNAVYQFLGVPIDQNQIIVYICVVATVVLGAVVLRYTEVGLKVRAMVDSPAMTDLSGTSPTAISVGVWAVSTFFAGLAGVLTAPLNGLDPSQFTLLIAASFAAVVAARLRSLPVAVIVGLLMGVATSLIQRYLPSDSQWTTGLINAIPFIVIALFLVYSLFRGGRMGETEGWGGALDRAITPQGESRLAGSTSNVVETASLNFVGKYAGPLLLIIAVAVAPLLVSGYWVGLFPLAFALGIICLSWTIVTGEGGMLWLCQITFAGVGALTTAQLANHYGWPVLAGAVVGGLIAGAMGAIIGFLSIRLGDLYVALVTLTFGLLMETLVFTLPSFVNQGIGLNLNRPEFASSDLSFSYLCLAVFVDLRPLHRELPTIDDRPGPQRGAVERGRRADLRHQRRADEGHRGGDGRAGRRHRWRALRHGADDVPAERVRHPCGRRLAGRAGHDRRPVDRGGPDRGGDAGLPRRDLPVLLAEHHEPARLAVHPLRPRRDLRRQVPRRRPGRERPATAAAVAAGQLRGTRRPRTVGRDQPHGR